MCVSGSENMFCRSGKGNNLKIRLHVVLSDLRTHLEESTLYGNQSTHIQMTKMSIVRNCIACIIVSVPEEIKNKDCNIKNTLSL